MKPIIFSKGWRPKKRIIKGICKNSIKLLIKMINISRWKHLVERLDIIIKEMNDIVLDNRFYYSLKGVQDLE